MIKEQKWSSLRDCEIQAYGTVWETVKYSAKRLRIILRKRTMEGILLMKLLR